MTDLPEMATPEELAKYLQVAVQTLKYWRRRNRGPAFVKVGNYVRYARADVMAYVKANKQITTGAA